MLNNNKELTEEIHNKYNRLVYGEAIKYNTILNRVSHYMLSIEDIEQEIWLDIHQNIDKYDENRAGLTTWVNLRCMHVQNDLLKRFNASKRNTSNLNLVYFDEPILEEKAEVKDMIGSNYDLGESITFEVLCCDYIYLIAKFVEILTYNQQIVLVHHLLDIPVSTTVKILGISQSYISRINKTNSTKLQNYIKRNRDNVDHNKAIKVYDALLNNTKCSEVKITKESSIICKVIMENILEVL